jgi:hypothetical protein
VLVTLILVWCAAANAADCREQQLSGNDITMSSCMVQAQQIAADQQANNLWLVNRRLSTMAVPSR